QDGQTLHRPGQMRSHAQFQRITDGVDEVEDRRRGRDLLFLEERISSVHTESPLAARAVDGVIQGEIYAACSDAGEVSKPVVNNGGDRLAAIANLRGADSVDLRRRRVARDQGGEVRLLCEKDFCGGNWRVNPPLVVDIEVRR